MARSSSKTPAQRAQEALDTANRVVERIEKRLEALEAEADKVGVELREAKRKRDYVALNPDLPKQGGGPLVADSPE